MSTNYSAISSQPPFQSSTVLPTNPLSSIRGTRLTQLIHFGTNHIENTTSIVIIQQYLHRCRGNSCLERAWVLFTCLPAALYGVSAQQGVYTPKSEEGGDMFLRIVGLSSGVKTRKVVLLIVLSVSRCKSYQIISWKATEIQEDKINQEIPGRTVRLLLLLRHRIA
jgi:hypothetical protein